MGSWREQFLSSTRGRIIEILRRGEATVSELAAELELTDNAVRVHLTKLQRDRLVVQSGRRPGVRKPEAVYSLDPAAEVFYPKAYGLLFSRLLEIVASRLPAEEVEEVLKEVGRSLAAEPPGDASLRERAAKALEAIERLGGLAELVENGEGIVIRGLSCPLAPLVKEHPAVCTLAEALLSEIAGIPVRETCLKGGTPRCRFLLGSD